MKQYKMVIVENDEDERFFMKQEFQANGAFEVMAEFDSGDMLLDWMANNTDDRPDIILSDMNMPGENGYDILSEVKSNPVYSEIRLVITSTSSVVAVKEKCLAMGAWDYLIKPEIFTQYGPYVENLHRQLEARG
jgi:CheY-like chemotaxis protein